VAANTAGAREAAKEKGPEEPSFAEPFPSPELARPRGAESGRCYIVLLPPTAVTGAVPL
jgi:hypothetical protein